MTVNIYVIASLITKYESTISQGERYFLLHILKETPVQFHCSLSRTWFLVNLPLVVCNRSTKQIKLNIFSPAMALLVSGGLYPLICLLWTLLFGEVIISTTSKRTCGVEYSKESAYKVEQE